MTESVRVRLAPSPTGPLHIGTVRTALYNYLFAKKHSGVFVLRMEDTDEVRSEKQYEEQILKGLVNLGLQYNEGPDIGGAYGPYRQSERTTIYRAHLEQLLESGDAYKCYCTKEELDEYRKQLDANKQPPRYSKKCRSISSELVQQYEMQRRPFTIRFKVPENELVEFSDLIRGEQKIPTSDIDDFIIARNLDSPIFHFAVTVDDFTMKITHVIRGEDHLPNTPKHVLLFRAFQKPIPVFAHLPLLLNTDRSKLSKRKNKVSIQDFLDQGYLPEALINFLALIGWNPGTDKEIFTIAELAEQFTLEKVHKGGAVFDTVKLDWINGMYIRQLKPENLLERLRPYWSKAKNYTGDEKYLSDIVALLQERLTRLSEINELDSFFFEEPTYDPQLLVGKKMEREQVLSNLRLAHATLALLKDVTTESAKQSLEQVMEAQKIKRGEMLWPIRVSLSGRDQSPGAYELIGVLGLEKTLERVEKAIKKLQP